MSDKPRDCKARQYSDQMMCDQCALAWDMNDPEPPECGQGGVDNDYQTEKKKVLYESAGNGGGVHDRGTNPTTRGENRGNSVGNSSRVGVVTLVIEDPEVVPNVGEPMLGGTIIDVQDNDYVMKYRNVDTAREMLLAKVEQVREELDEAREDLQP